MDPFPTIVLQWSVISQANTISTNSNTPFGSPVIARIALPTFQTFSLWLHLKPIAMAHPQQSLLRKSPTSNRPLLFVNSTSSCSINPLLYLRECVAQDSYLPSQPRMMSRKCRAVKQTWISTNPLRDAHHFWTG